MEPTRLPDASPPLHGEALILQAALAACPPDAPHRAALAALCGPLPPPAPLPARAQVLAAITQASHPLVQDSSADPYHRTFADFVARVNQFPAPRVLELGSYRSTLRPRFPAASAYVGVDVRPGPGVDVVGDVHALTTLLATEPPFDAVVSISVFEHLAMPWVVVLELNRVLRDGGLVCVATHPTWPPHELPWDFWRFLDGAMQVLFTAATGFAVLACTSGLPGLVLPLGTDASTVGLLEYPAPLGISVLARKIGPPRADLAWPLTAADVLTTAYPAALPAPPPAP